ncbi:hypothetical protein E2P81_ATG07128 [Venturia nashicola]|nr:hypothetical protein E2P81_ATG07128 [Venturia nashicola]
MSPSDTTNVSDEGNAPPFQRLARKGKVLESAGLGRAQRQQPSAAIRGEVDPACRRWQGGGWQMHGHSLAGRSVNNPNRQTAVRCPREDESWSCPGPGPGPGPGLPGLGLPPLGLPPPGPYPCATTTESRR